MHCPSNLIFPVGNTPEIEAVNLVADRKMHLKFMATFYFLKLLDF